MNAVLPGEPRWGARRWIYVTGFVFTLQAALILFFSQPAQAPPARPTLRPRVHLLADPWSVQQLSLRPGVTDPTLLALPDVHSFSGAAWMRAAPLDYKSEPWSEPPRWLSMDAQGLGGRFGQMVATNVLTPPTIADKPAPPMLRYEPNFPSEPLPAQSTLRVEGELAARRLLQTPELKLWPHHELLSNSVVQVVVDADGFALSREPLGSCGLPEADRQALALANTLRFQPLPRSARDATGRGPLAWGKLVFRWYTLAPSATNAPAAPP